MIREIAETIIGLNFIIPPWNLNILSRSILFRSMSRSINYKRSIISAEYFDSRGSSGDQTKLGLGLRVVVNFKDGERKVGSGVFYTLPRFKAHFRLVAIR
jgi:hypothetical protein